MSNFFTGCRILAETARWIPATQGTPAGNKAGHKGVDGSAKSGQITAVQYQAADSARSFHTTTFDTLLTNQPRFWIARHCGRPHGHTEFFEWIAQAFGKSVSKSECPRATDVSDFFIGQSEIRWQKMTMYRNETRYRVPRNCMCCDLNNDDDDDDAVGVFETYYSWRDVNLYRLRLC